MKMNRGFTLIELVLVIVLVGILGATGSLLLRQTFKSYIIGKKITNLAINTNVATDILMRELKNIESLSALGATTVTYVNHNGETVVIDLNGTNLRRNVNAAGVQTLCDKVSSVTFSFFDSAFTTTATAANVRFISLQITTTEDGYPYTLITGTVLRKLLG